MGPAAPSLLTEQGLNASHPAPLCLCWAIPHALPAGLSGLSSPWSVRYHFLRGESQGLGQVPTMYSGCFESHLRTLRYVNPLALVNS